MRDHSASSKHRMEIVEILPRSIVRLDAPFISRMHYATYLLMDPDVDAAVHKVRQGKKMEVGRTDKKKMVGEKKIRGWVQPGELAKPVSPSTVLTQDGTTLVLRLQICSTNANSINMES